MKLKDVTLQEIKGIWGDELQDGEKGTPVIKTNNLTYEGHVDLSHITFRNIPASKVTNCLLRYGDLLIEKSGGTKTHSVGYVNIFEDKNDEYVANNFIFVLRPNSKLIDSKYLFYQLKYRYESGQIEHLHNQTTGIQNLKVQSYLNQEIKYVSIQTQQKISNKLDKIEKAIKLEKSVLNSLDALIKSRFIEMFGDVESNTHNYPIKKLSEISEYWNGLTYKPTDVADNRKGTLVLRSSNIQNGQLCFYDNVFVNCQIKERHIVKENDILMCSRNGSSKLVGKVALIKGLNKPTSFGAFMMIIRSKYYQYLKLFFESVAFKHQISTGTATINQITGNMLNTIKLPVPPMIVIDEFAEFVNQIDKLKFSI